VGFDVQGVACEGEARGRGQASEGGIRCTRKRVWRPNNSLQLTMAAGGSVQDVLVACC
jgi:hypothetical protein